MKTLEQAKCKGCGKPVIWAEIIKQDGTVGRVPLDPAPPVYGLSTEGTWERMNGKNIKDDYVREHPCYVSHFNTCPKASEF